MSRFTKASRSEEKIIAALLEAPSVTEAARRCGISERTFWRYLKRDDFRQRYESAKRQILEHAMNRLQTSMGEAVETLREIARDADNPPAARVAAARAVLEFGLRALETGELAERLSRLEELAVGQAPAKGGLAGEA